MFWPAGGSDTADAFFEGVPHMANGWATIRASLDAVRCIGIEAHDLPTGGSAYIYVAK